METTKQLKVGSVYRIHHSSKGAFVAQLIDIVKADEGDEYDDVLLRVKYDVRAGTDQIGLSVIPGKQEVRVSRLRPSKIISIEELEGEDWLRQIKVREEEQPVLAATVVEHSLVDKLKSLFKRS